MTDKTIDKAGSAEAKWAITEDVKKDAAFFSRIYDTLWKAVERENNLIHQRLSWPLTLTAGFITAEAFLARPLFDPDPGSRQEGMVLCGLLCAISFSGVLFSFIAGLSIQAARDQIKYIREYYEGCLLKPETMNYSTENNLFECRLQLPRPWGDPRAHGFGKLASQIYPYILSAGWATLFLLEAAAFWYCHRYGHFPFHDIGKAA